MIMQTTIVLQGILPSKWESGFEGLKFSYIDGKTFIIGEVKDNSALHGILNQIRNLNLKIISLYNTYNQ